MTVKNEKASEDKRKYTLFIFHGADSVHPALLLNEQVKKVEKKYNVQNVQDLYDGDADWKRFVKSYSRVQKTSTLSPYLSIDFNNINRSGIMQKH